VKENMLYLYPINGENPNKAVILAQTNDYCINENEAVCNITIVGVDFMGCSVKLGNVDNKNISFKEVHFTYIGVELLYVDRVQGREIDKPKN
jgi:hypothetical protein